MLAKSPRVARPARTVIGLGSNIGDRLGTLRESARRISVIAPIVASSRVWESAPVGGPPQGDYLNAAVLIDASLDPFALLDALSAIESDLGRTRTVKDGPRTIDLDILWMGAEIIEHPRLVVPHPRLHERAFALLPLLEIVPGATDPRTGAPYAALDLPGGQRVRPHPESFAPIG